MELVELQTIWKYELAITDKQVIEMPMYSDILKVMFQDNKLQMWSKATRSREPIEYQIYIIGTGNQIPYVAMNYLDSVIDSDGLVWHIFVGI